MSNRYKAAKGLSNFCICFLMVCLLLTLIIGFVGEWEEPVHTGVILGLVGTILCSILVIAPIVHCYKGEYQYFKETGKLYGPYRSSWAYTSPERKSPLPSYTPTGPTGVRWTAPRYVPCPTCGGRGSYFGARCHRCHGRRVINVLDR